MFGEIRIFDRGKGCETELDGARLVLSQEREGAGITVDEQGTVGLRLPLTSQEKDFGFATLIEEDVHQQIMAGLRYTAWLLDRIDPTQRLSHVAIAARIAASEYAGWRTRQQQEAYPRRANMGRGGNADVDTVRVSKPRAALRLEAGPLSEDLLVLLRRQWKG